MFITPSFKKSLIVEQFQGNYLKKWKFYDLTWGKLILDYMYWRWKHRYSPVWLSDQHPDIYSVNKYSWSEHKELQELCDPWGRMAYTGRLRQ